MSEVLQGFSPPVRAWFEEAFERPSPAQELGWPAVGRGEHTLIVAPTGSGKTLAAFLWSLDRLFTALQQDPDAVPAGVHTLYISPLKALGYDVERNLKAPLRGIRQAARRLGQQAPGIRVAVRTGDTSASHRAAMLRKPPHVLITTPESLFILLTSARGRGVLSTVRQVIVDEVHAVLGNKRGCSLALSLERLQRLCPKPPPVRVGLSATVRPLSQAARFLGGVEPGGEARPVTVVDAGQRKRLDLQVMAPVADFTRLAGDSVWPEVYPLLLQKIRARRSTLIFVRMRAQAERTARALNELAGEPLARPHYSSVSSAVRRQMEERLKRGELPALISTGTMELGIDVGFIDLVLQLNAPGSVSSGLQRVGRAGHLMGQTSSGRLLPLYREDLVECTVLARAMLQGAIEATAMPRNALDVVAQHVVSEVAMGDRTGAELLDITRRAAPYADLPRDALDSVLALLAGRYPAEVARGLSAKLVWERSSDRVSGLRGARMLAVTAGGTIPDSGYFRLELADGTRLGELEEEFVFERKAGDAISFASASWRILKLDGERVVVAPAPGQKAVVPFWKGGLFGRDPDVGERIGAFRRQLYEKVQDPAAAGAWLRDEYPVDDWAADNLVRYFGDQRRRGHPVGSDRQLVLEACRDEMGDHRLVIHSCFGNRVNAPLAMLLRHRLRDRLGVDPQVISDDNALLVRMPEGDAPPPLDLVSDLLPLSAERLRELVLAELSGSPMYGTLFRQNASRFLVLGTRGPGRRNPLWLQRLRAKDLQQATAHLPDFPVRLETLRECLQQMMDLPRLESLLQRVRQGQLELVPHANNRAPSPVASGLLNAFVGRYMYEYDEPRAERTIRRLQVDRELLDQVLDGDQAEGLLLPSATHELQGRWQGLEERSRARDAGELLSLVLRLVLLPQRELDPRCEAPAAGLLAPLLQDGRLRRLRLAQDPLGEPWICAGEDLPLLQSALLPQVVEADAPAGEEHRQPAARQLPPGDARQLLVQRVLEQLGPVSTRELAARCLLPLAQIDEALRALSRQGRVLQGPLLQGAGDRPLVCARASAERIRRRSLTHLRAEIEPLPLPALQRLVLDRQLLQPAALPPRQALPRALEALALRPLPAELLERQLLPARVPGYRPGDLDDLVAGGELLWTGAGSGRVVLLAPDQLPLLGRPPVELSPAEGRILDALRQRGASFLSEVCAATGLRLPEVQRGLWQLVWAGRASNDRLESLRQGLVSGFEPAPEAAAISPLTGRPPAPGHRRARRGWRAARGSLRAGNPWSGRWSALPSPDDGGGGAAAIDLVWLLVRRHGLLARELVGQEDGPAWSELYPLLCQLELSGELRRGIFVEGLGGAQFAPAETVDRLRSLREAPQPALLVNACDPALVAPALGLGAPGGATAARRPGNQVVLEDGRPVLLAEGQGRQLTLDLQQDPARVRHWLTLLCGLLKRGQRAVRVEQVNGQPVLDSPLRPLLQELGFRRDGQALERRRYG
jgi:ATP-dependent Lhr-like helicase